MVLVHRAVVKVKGETFEFWITVKGVTKIGLTLKGTLKYLNAEFTDFVVKGPNTENIPRVVS